VGSPDCQCCALLCISAFPSHVACKIYDALTWLYFPWRDRSFLSVIRLGCRLSLCRRSSCAVPLLRTGARILVSLGEPSLARIRRPRSSTALVPELFSNIRPGNTTPPLRLQEGAFDAIVRRAVPLCRRCVVRSFPQPGARSSVDLFLLLSRGFMDPRYSRPRPGTKGGGCGLISHGHQGGLLSFLTPT